MSAFIFVQHENLDNAMILKWAVSVAESCYGNISYIYMPIMRQDIIVIGLERSPEEG
jgi:hypothetical protein